MTDGGASAVFATAPHPVPPERARRFDALLADLAARPDHDHQGPVDLTGAVPGPVWELLVHAAATGRYALHGSGSDAITAFEPRQSNDVHEFGNRSGVYAAADGLWPFYFAIVDRDRIDQLVNAAFVVVDRETGAETGPLYFFSVASRDPAPWRDGTVYLLPIDGFEREAEVDRPEGRVRSAQLFHPGPVRPLARVRVRPDEFPLLSVIRHHDADELGRRAAADPDGFPWL